MNYHLRSLLIKWLLCVVLLAHSVLGQTLSIVRQGKNDYRIQAVAPPNIRYTLQESVNLSLWVDKCDTEWNFSFQPFDNAAISAITRRYYRLTLWTEPAPSIIIVLIGDSTVADLASNGGWVCGWGQGIYGYFKSNVRVVNLAMPGHGTKVFIGSEEMTKMVVLKPNFVFMQYGFMDERDGDISRRTTLTEFADNLKTIVKHIRSVNGKPILISQPVIRMFNDKGKVIPMFEERCAVMKEVAAGLQADFINLNQLSMDLYNELGESGSAFMKSDIATDIFHYSQKGAQALAGLVVNALPNSLGTYLTGIFDHPPKP